MSEAQAREGRPTHRVIATAGHVDHGKSSLVARLTGIDPDRWPEEKRRGLTIDLGYAWCVLPSGREVGFVDVPGHERFIRNMLAGVGPAPIVLLVVAADEGWKPQSEEHLEILDVLSVASGVVALTKRDLVDDETCAIAVDEVRERLAGTSLADAPLVAVSSTTGEGLDELRVALDDVIARTRPPRDAPLRLFVDRAFTIKGAGTVATGTLTGDCLAVGDDVAIEPGGRRARVRSLQTHRATEQVACPVSRVAANLVGVEREDLERGDVMTRPGAWAPVSSFDIELRAVRSLGAPLTSRGAFKMYAGAAETDTTIRLLDGNRLEAGATAFARLRTSRPLVLGVGDRVVIREAGRRRTVGGGVVLDVEPGKATGAVARLAARLAASPGELAALVVHERGALPADDVLRLAGTPAEPSSIVGDWAIDPPVREALQRRLVTELGAFHAREPLAAGMPLADARSMLATALRETRAPIDAALVETLLEDMLSSGAVDRVSGSVRLAGHRVALERHDPDVQRLLDAIGGDHEATPPTIAELVAAGVGRSVIDAAASAGLVVQASKELVFTPALVERAKAIVAAAPDGITVSAFREALHTSRKFALPLLEHFDRTGVSRRDGDLRFPR
ncbi:MAG TPA: selenocysteine-specific translation elongation factor [Actinomycetota bacterium]